VSNGGKPANDVYSVSFAVTRVETYTTDGKPLVFDVKDGATSTATVPKTP